MFGFLYNLLLVTLSGRLFRLPTQRAPCKGRIIATVQPNAPLLPNWTLELECAAIETLEEPSTVRGVRQVCRIHWIIEPRAPCIDLSRIVAKAGRLWLHVTLLAAGKDGIVTALQLHTVLLPGRAADREGTPVEALLELGTIGRDGEMDWAHRVVVLRAAPVRYAIFVLERIGVGRQRNATHQQQHRDRQQWLKHCTEGWLIAEGTLATLA